MDVGASPPAQLIEQALGPDSKTSRPQWTPFLWVGSGGAHLTFRAAPQLTCVVSVADIRLARVAETAGVPSSLVGTREEEDVRFYLQALSQTQTEAVKRKERKAPGSGRQQTQTREADAAVTAGGLKITLPAPQRSRPCGGFKQ